MREHSSRFSSHSLLVSDISLWNRDNGRGKLNLKRCLKWETVVSTKLEIHMWVFQVVYLRGNFCQSIASVRCRIVSKPPPLISSPCHSTSTTTVDLLNISKCWKQGENVGFLAQQPFTISVSNRAVGMGAARTRDTHTWVCPTKTSQVEWSCAPKHSLETATSKKWSHWWLQKPQQQPKKKRLLDLSCYSVYQ